MPNGHGGIPRFGSPILILIVFTIIYVLRKHVPLYNYLKYALALLLAWRLAWHIAMYPAMEYGGHHTTEKDSRNAKRKYGIALVVCAVVIGGVAWWL